MRVLVTGHLGYIGTVPMLLRSGHEVVGLDSDLYEGCTFAASGGIVPVPYLRKDVRDVGRCDLEGLDAIIHLSALSNDPLGDLRPEPLPGVGDFSQGSVFPLAAGDRGCGEAQDVSRDGGCVTWPAVTDLSTAKKACPSVRKRSHMLV
jgi:hypothetical protein